VESATPFRWLYDVHQVARVSSGTLSGRFDPRRSRSWLWRFSGWKLKGIYCEFPIVIECKMLMWKFSGHLTRRNQFAKSFNSDLGSACYISEMACLVCLAACSLAYVSPHSTGKSNYLDQMSCKSTTDLVNMTKTNLLRYYRNFESDISYSVELQSFLLLFVFFCYNEYACVHSCVSRK
jgi:hypothetical protein